MKRILIVTGFIILFATIAISKWIALQPTIKPDDVVIRGFLKKNSLSQEPKLPTKEGYAIEVYIDNKSTLPLSTLNDKRYFHVIYPFVHGFSNAGWDFFKGIDEEGAAKGGEGYSFGSHSSAIKNVVEHLQAESLIKGDYKEIEALNSLTGFTYLGNNFPTSTRIYLSPTDKEPDISKAAVIYTHIEQRWCKDLSWTKLLPLQYIER